jgi:hypothetical protein
MLNQMVNFGDMISLIFVLFDKRRCSPYCRYSTPKLNEFNDHNRQFHPKSSIIIDNLMRFQRL